jgi:uncharacterized DUF497 family protein
MQYIDFEWNKTKAQGNLIKHGISFEEAKSVFLDENARVIPDPSHSDSEDRFVILGISDRLRILIVCHCYRKNDEIIRIISARKATRNESKAYGEYS